MRYNRFLFFFVLLTACSAGEKPLVFVNEINYFEEGFISHFPENIPKAFSLKTVSPNTRNSHPHVWLKYYENDRGLIKLKDSIEQISIARYNSDDSCLLVIDKHLNKSNWFRIDKTKRMPKEIDYRHKKCHESKYPVPNFYSTDWSETTKNPTRLNGYNLYVLEAKSGIHMDSTKLPNGLYTPKGWEHGYSKGIAINEKTNAVIFWADIW